MAVRRNNAKWILGLFGIFVFAGILEAESGRSVPGFDIVYPPAQSAVKFSHQRHADHECLTCHASVVTSDASSDRNLPSERVCAGCHTVAVRETVNEPGNQDRCGLCHADFDPSGKSRPDRVNWPVARLTFSHQSHLGRMIACSTCHSGVDIGDVSGQRHLPKEAVCLTCHSRQDKNGSCALCHPSDPAGALQTDFGGVKLVPLEGALNHQNDWMRRHVTEAQISRSTCTACHQQRFCSACHDGVMKPLRIHPEDYVTTHPIDARKQTPRCQSCHRFQSFCLDCHRKLGVGPESVRKDGRTRIHPPGWGDCVRGLTHHADQARRNLAACVSCHTESDCLTCHKAGSACGGNVNVHGHMSDGQLSRMQKLNPRACEKCHEKK
jgi:hypothetical protein